ncbi:MAG: DNA gyrase inhibitor YacG [Proteobacteria bacterium]|nr:DNA gyrase inhibitor YacG [Pseudomonadota bacterium]
MNDRTPPLRAVRIAAKCPTCGKAVAEAYRPFCSKRCADIDLGRWLKEGYRIPTDEGPIDDENGSRGPSGQEP